MDLTVYPQFIEDYNNPSLTGEDVRRRCNLNPARYSEIRAIAIKNGDIPQSRRMNRSNARFFTKTQNGYTVKKQFGNDCIYIGNFPTQTTAEKVVAKCKEVNWNVNEIQDFIDSQKTQPKNYSLSGNHYLVQKSINGRNIVFCTLKEEKQAQKMVQELRKCNWDINQVDTIMENLL